MLWVRATQKLWEASKLWGFYFIYLVETLLFFCLQRRRKSVFISSGINWILLFYQILLIFLIKYSIERDDFIILWFIYLIMVVYHIHSHPMQYSKQFPSSFDTKSIGRIRFSCMFKQMDATCYTTKFTTIFLFRRPNVNYNKKKTIFSSLYPVRYWSGTKSHCILSVFFFFAVSGRTSYKSLKL